MLTVSSEATGIWYGDALIGAFSFRREADGLRLTCADRALRLFFARLGFVAAVGDEMVKDARCVLPPLPAAYMR